MATRKRTSEDVWRQAANLTFSITQVLAPGLFLLGVGEDIGTRSDEVRALIVPPAWTFSIWSVLFAGSFAYALYQATPSKGADPLLRRIGWATAGAYLANTLWETETVLRGVTPVTPVIIVAMLVCLTVALVKLSRPDTDLGGWRRWIVAAPISGLAAWITAATIVNVASALKGLGIDGGTQAPAIGAAVIAAGVAVAVTVLIRNRGNPWFAAVFCWALVGVTAASLEPARLAPPVTIVAVGGIIAVAGAAVLTLRRSGAARHWFGNSASSAR